VWIGEKNDVPYVYEIGAQGQQYDASFNKLPGKFDNCSGNGCIPAATCGVTVRIPTINADRGPGCATHAYGHALESQVHRNQIPYYAKNAERFFNFGLDKRHGTSFGDFYMCPYYPASGTCIDFVAPNHITNGSVSPDAFDIPSWGDGCGNVHFSPPAQNQYDDGVGVVAKATCEGYGLGQGPGGQDAMSNVGYSDYQTLDQNPAYSDCGGGWQIYMRQSMPGYQNQAKDVDGGPMKNWWPFLFY
jgi:hypothetical protein